MKNFLLKGLFFSACASFSLCSFAAGPGWISSVKVTRIVAVVNGGINVRVTPELTGCTSQSGYGPAFASVYPDHPGKQNIQSILLAAYMADKPVSIYLADNTCKVSEVVLGDM